MRRIRPRMKTAVSPELGPCRVEEDWDCIRLFLPSADGIGAILEFGKRAPYYYRCLVQPPELADQCHCLLQRRPFDLYENSEKFNAKAELLREEKGWPRLFRPKVKRGKRGETTVIEETKQRVSFHFQLDTLDHASISYRIRNDNEVGCEASPSRGCSRRNPRVSYTTFRQFTHDIQSPIFSGSGAK